MIEIDGSYGEGGGQILRTTLALAAVLGKEVRVFNIRGGRGEPGLRAQHVTSAKALATICSATLKGLELGSTEFIFRPEKLRAGRFQFDVGTAGSITLVLQTLMPLFPFLPGRVDVEITGGTDVKWSPPVDYVRLVMLPILGKVGYQGTLQLVRRGHYPKGGGRVRFGASPSAPLQPITESERGDVTKILGASHAVRLPRHVAERQAAAASQVLLKQGLPYPQVEIDVSENGLGPGSGVAICAVTNKQAVLGADSLGERGMSAEDVGLAAGRVLPEELEPNAFLDRHMGDMVVPYLVLAEGVSEVSISQVTQHTLTNVKVAEWVGGVHFDSVGEMGKPGRLRVNGLGLKPLASASPKK